MEVLFVGCLGPGVQRPSGVSNYVMNVLGELPKLGIRASLIGVGPTLAVDLPYEFISISSRNGHTSYGFLMRLLASNPSLDFSKDTIINVHRPDDLIPFLLHRRGNPGVITLHGTHFRNVYLNWGRLMGKAYDFLERYSVKRSYQLITVSRNTKDLFVKRYPEKDGFIHYIPPGVNTHIFGRSDRLEARKSFGFREDDFLVLYAGRIEKEKRLDILMKTLSPLRRKLPNVKLVLAGEGRDMPRLKILAASHIGSSVFMLGHLSQRRLARLMSASNVFCLLSVHEGFPSVVLEALACGLPVVSTSVGDVPEVVIEGLTGSILNTLDAEEIAQRLWKVGAAQERLAPECVKVAGRHSWKRVAKRTAEVYEKVMASAT